MSLEQLEMLESKVLTLDEKLEEAEKQLKVSSAWITSKLMKVKLCFILASQL